MAAAVFSPVMCRSGASGLGPGTSWISPVLRPALLTVGGSWCLLGRCSTSDAGRCLAAASSAATAVPSLVVGRAASLVLCGTAGVFALGA